MVPYTPPVILPTLTPQPTQTPPLPTTVPATAKPTQAVRATPTRGSAPAPAQPTAAALPTTAPPPPTALIYPASALNTPPNGDSIGANNIRFSWGYNQVAGAYDVPQLLPADQFYRVTVSYTSKSQNKLMAINICLHETSMDRRTGLDLTDYRSDALDGSFKWNVTLSAIARLFYYAIVCAALIAMRAPAMWRLLLFFPFLFGALGVFQSRDKT